MLYLKGMCPLHTVGMVRSLTFVASRRWMSTYSARVHRYQEQFPAFTSGQLSMDSRNELKISYIIEHSSGFQKFVDFSHGRWLNILMQTTKPLRCTPIRPYEVQYCWPSSMRPRTRWSPSIFCLPLITYRLLDFFHWPTSKLQGLGLTSALSGTIATDLCLKLTYGATSHQGQRRTGLSSRSPKLGKWVYTTSCFSWSN